MIFDCIWVLLALTTILATATPTSDAADGPTILTKDTAIGDIKFGREPHGRGTWGILFGCTITFGFCIWTAIHPDIIAKASNSQRIFSKAILMILAVFVPEGVIVCAFGQWREARELNSAWQKKYKETKPDYLGMDGAFFVVMGGFVIHGKPEGAEPDCQVTTHPGSNSQPLHQYNREYTDYTVTLTPKGFLKYMNQGLIEHTTFNKREIVDKGKASDIAKIVSSFQAVWLIIQCFTRWGSGLPVTLLEIHVLIQVGCALITYACWWHKPLDVYEPISITVPIIINIPEDLDGCWLDMEDKSRKKVLKEEEQRPEDLPYTFHRCPTNLMAVAMRAIYGIGVYIDVQELSAGKKNESTELEAQYAKTDLAGNRIAKFKAIIAEGILVCVVGILHAAAWNVDFPTVLERRLWQVSSIGMCIIPIFGAIAAAATSYDREVIERLRKASNERMSLSEMGREYIRCLKEQCSIRMRGSRLRYATHMFLCLTLTIALCVYISCILFITVESYVSLRYPPEETFVTPVWGDYWPHL